LPLFAAAIVAILPQYTFVSASYNNDNLVPVLIAASIYSLVRGYKEEARFRWYLLAALFGLLAMFTKRTAIGIVPILGIAILAYAVRWIRSGSRKARAGGVLVFAGLALALAALVGVFLAPPSIPGNLARLLRFNPDALLRLSTSLQGTAALSGVDWPWFFRFLLRSFWGWFGWLTIPIAEGWENFWGVITLLLGLGTVVGLLRWWREPKDTRPALLPFTALLILGGWIGSLAALIALFLPDPAIYPPQGRYLFPLLPLLAVIGVWSWKSLFPSRMQRGALFASWIVISIYDLYVWAFVLIPEWYS
jgi:4-amino-4-deoxy-L-arabinose transferase-like glycosyltransferase